MGLLFFGSFYAAEPVADGTAIDWERARQLRQKSMSGPALAPEEKAYLDRAMAERAAGKQSAPQEVSDRETMQRLMEKRRKGGTLTADEEALVRRIRQRDTTGSKQDASATPPAPAREKTGLVPLSEMTGEQRYKGEDGGLYGGGRNTPPPGHLAAAIAAAREIKPLDATGKASASGRIGLLAVGMSNTTQEFSRFQELAARDSEKSANVVLVDGAQGGRTAAEWARAGTSAVWQTVESRLQAAKVTAAQVQVVWMKQANARPTEPFPEHAKKLEQDMAVTVKRLKTTFPNLRIVYMSSRTYAGYAGTALNPEPYAYESSFAVRALIWRQINGDAELGAPAGRGTGKSPVLLWGPYLWADGITPRKADGLAWLREDFREDGTHPSVTSGRDKVARQLLAFFKTDPTAKIWFGQK